MGQVTSGNHKALSVLAERYYPSLLAYLYHALASDRVLAEDLAQETFVCLLRQHTYQPDRPFKPWFFAIATNLVRNYYASAVVRHSVPDFDSHQEADTTEEFLLKIVDPAPGPEAWVLQHEKGQLIAQAFGELSEEYRLALVLRFYANFSLQEIAQALQIPPGTVKSRLSVIMG